MTTDAPLAFDPAGMRSRKDAYFRTVRSRASEWFHDDGTYRPNMDPDGRSTFWIFPALIASDDPAEREFALRVYAASACWDGWDVFITSIIATHLARERDRLTPELIARSEQHLARFAVVDRGRKPCSGANDYVFHGYNDNMPAMSTRTLLLAGELLDRPDLTDQGLFRLEGLCAHFARRGLLSEYNSGTYTPIAATALMDVAECCRNAEVAEMAAACANRVVLDILAHWHRPTGALSGSSSRAYVGDATITLTNTNALMWYLTGDPLCIPPAEGIDLSAYDGPLHHGPDEGFLAAQFVEFFSPSYEKLSDGVVAYARAPRSYPHEVHATTDAGRTASIRTRLYQQPGWTLGTASRDMWAGSSGQHLTCFGTLARKPDPAGWRDRLAFWHYLQGDQPDLGETMPSYNDTTALVTNFCDYGCYHTVQKAGSAMVLAHLGPRLVGQDASQLRLVIAFGTLGRQPDEMFAGDELLTEWSGAGDASQWQFLRFGEVYVGIRAAGMRAGAALPVRRCVKNDYLRVDVPILEGEKTPIDAEFCKRLDLGYVVEMADAGECGSFEAFRRQCAAATWELFHCFYRSGRYVGRNGELQIIDTIDPDAVRFAAVDGEVEEPAFFTAGGLDPKLDTIDPDAVRFAAVDGEVEEPAFFTAGGLDPKLIELLPDGRRVTQRRISYWPDFVGSPFYDTPSNVVVADLPGPA